MFVCIKKGYALSLHLNCLKIKCRLLEDFRFLADSRWDVPEIASMRNSSPYEKFNECLRFYELLQKVRGYFEPCVGFGSYIIVVCVAE